MPVAVVQDWVEPVSERSGASYDRISERLGAKDDPPKGLLMHSAGHTGGGFPDLRGVGDAGGLRRVHRRAADAGAAGGERLGYDAAAGHDLRAAQLHRHLRRSGHDVRGRAALEQDGAERADAEHPHRDAGVARGAADVRREDDVLEREQRLGDLGLVLVDVEPGAGDRARRGAPR